MSMAAQQCHPNPAARVDRSVVDKKKLEFCDLECASECAQLAGERGAMA
jgi:hypothetical protein